MEFYKLPNKFGDYGLDYCTELDGWNYKIAFAHKGEEGTYHKDVINFRDTEYPANKDYINNHSRDYFKTAVRSPYLRTGSFYMDKRNYKQKYLKQHSLKLIPQKQRFGEYILNLK